MPKKSTLVDMRRFNHSVVSSHLSNSHDAPSSKEKPAERVPERSAAMSEEDCNTKELEEVMGLMSLVKKRIQMKKSYFQLVALLCFFCVYSAAITVQRNTFSAFRIHSRCCIAPSLIHLLILRSRLPLYDVDEIFDTAAFCLN